MRRLLLITLLALAGCTSEDWDPMEEQPKPLPYKPSSMFPDGRAMRPVPEDTVAREAPRGTIAYLRDVPDGGFFVEPPRQPLTQAALDRGQEVFDIYCAACHGLRGDGRSVVATKMSLRAPPNLMDSRIRNLDDDQLFGVITEGYGMMPPLRTWIAAQDRWRVVAYLRALQLSTDVPASQLDPRDLRELQKGTP